MDSQTQMKQAVADAAIREVKSDMVLGLGSGSTAALMIKSLSDEIRSGQIKNIKEVKILNLWVVRQFKGEYNPIHYHTGDLSGVGYLTLPKNMTKNNLVKNKKLKTNGTIDFINGQKAFLSNSIYNLIPKIGDLIIFPNYLMHTAYPFNINGERRSFSFNVKIIFKK